MNKRKVKNGVHAPSRTYTSDGKLENPILGSNLWWNERKGRKKVLIAAELKSQSSSRPPCIPNLPTR